MRGADWARLGVGTAVLCWPGVPARLTRTPASARVLLATRILATRYVAQAAVGAVGNARRTATADVAVEGLHAVSMIGLARLRPDVRRLALLSAGAATALAVADSREVRAS